jgi:hypothetical protein
MGAATRTWLSAEGSGGEASGFAAVGQHRDDLAGGGGPGQQVAGCGVAADVGEDLELAGMFDSFGQDLSA